MELSKDGGDGESSNATEIKASQAHARRVLADDEAGNTIGRVASKLILLVDKNRDGRVNLSELAQLFETIFESSRSHDEHTPTETFPQPLRALAGSLQLLPPNERQITSQAAEKSELYHSGVAGDDHTLRRVILEDGGHKGLKKNR